MTEPRDQLADALHRLRGEIRSQVPVPAAAGLRARATHRLRVRRAGTAVLAAAAVAAIAIGGSTLLQPTAAPPVPPAESPTPSVSRSPAPVTPSPRPSPRPVEPVDDPIAEVDWQHATITIPPRAGCPEGPVSFVAVSDIIENALGPPDGFPKIMIDATHAAYGDLTGDGRAEAVIDASCADSEEGLTSGHGGQLLVVTRTGDGTLRGLGWTGPPGAAYLSYWISDGRLLIDADPWTAGEEDFFEHIPGLALSYRWDGSGFTGWEPAPEYPPIMPQNPTGTGPPIRPRAAVAARLGCPDEEVRFASSIDVLEWPLMAPTSSGGTYAIPTLDSSQPYLFDLDRSGERLLALALACLAPPTVVPPTVVGLAVFERAGDGWQGISVVLSPDGDGSAPAAWSLDGEQLLVDWPGGDDDLTAYRWTGTVLEPVD